MKNTFFLQLFFLTFIPLNLLTMGDLSNEEIIKSSITGSYTQEGWNKAKKNITKAANEGAKINIFSYDTFGHTPLSLAVSKNDLDFAQFLLEKGADPNLKINGIHSSKAIFAAESLEMAQLLIQFGADINGFNDGRGWHAHMNLLQRSISPSCTDDRLFDFFRKKGFNPKSVTSARGDNLWLCLVGTSLRYCPLKRFTNRANRLHQLGISPYQKNGWNFNAIDNISAQIEDEEKFINDMETGKRKPPYPGIDLIEFLKDRKKGLEILKVFRKIMENVPNKN